MSEEAKKPSGPDLAEGIAITDIADGGLVLGHVGDEAVLLARRGEELFAVGATCTHYHGPLAEGLMVGDTVRCPWHHACFSLRTGEAVRAPALDPDRRAGASSGRATRSVSARSCRAAPKPRAADRRRGWPGSRRHRRRRGGGQRRGGDAAPRGLRPARSRCSAPTMTPPCDRPNLSKDYLAGTAPEEWIPLQPPEFYAEREIELLLGARVDGDRPGASARHARRRRGRSTYGALLLATGADPVRLDDPRRRSARTCTTCARSPTAARSSRRRRRREARASCVGASFIGLEVAASLRARGLEVHVVAPEARPLERVLGPELGRLRPRAARGARRRLPPRGRRSATIEAKRRSR